MNSFLFSFKETAKAFLFLKPERAKAAPFVHDAIDIKRIMTLVVMSTLPATFFAILYSGMFATLYESINVELLKSYQSSSQNIFSFFSFILSHFGTFFWRGIQLFIPQLIIIYATGGLIEIFFASLHRKTVSEGFFVTGILFALILPPTLPYWMTIFGVTVGLILGKEIFGGTGMNIFNPALVCRCILYFSFPSYMTGNIWVGSDQFTIANNLAKYNQELQTNSFDAITTASALNITEMPHTISRLQIDALALAYTKDVSLKKELSQRLAKFNPSLDIEQLTPSQIVDFAIKELGFPEEQIENGARFARIVYGYGKYSFANFFFGNMVGSFGETSKFAILLGALFLLFTGMISWRIFFPCLLAAFATAYCFYLYSLSSPNTPAHFMISPFKQLFMGGLMFGAIFMTTDPVSAPTTKTSQVLYGCLIGALTIIIRLINPAFPEGVMLAILFANSFSPLLDRMVLCFRRQKIHGNVIYKKLVIDETL